MQATVLEEPPLEFGYSGKHQEQRAGLAQNGPADIEMPGRKDEARVGLVGPTKMLDELETWLQKCAGGVAAKPTDLLTLFPEFPGCTRELGFKTQLTLPADARRPLTKARLKQITDAPAERAKLSAAVHLCAEEVLALLDRAPVDVVMVVRPDGVPEGVTSGAGTGANFHDLLKAALMVATVHQLVRDLAGSVVSDETVEHRFSIADGRIERMDVLDHWTIRSAGEKDIPAVLDLWVVAGSVPSISDSPEGLARLVAADPRALLVAEFDGVLVGSLIAAWDGWRGSFYRLAVSPEHRRNGLATMLLREGERRLRERGALRLTAIVADDEPGAMSFWRAVGYTRQGARARFVCRVAG